MVEIATTGTRVQHRRPNVGHVRRWVTLSVFKKKQQRVEAVHNGSPHVYTEQEQRSYDPVFVDAKNVHVLCNSLIGRSMSQMADVSRLGALSKLRLNSMVDE